MTTTTERPAPPLTDCPLTEPHTTGSLEDHWAGCRCPKTVSVHRIRLDMDARRKYATAMGRYTPDRVVDAAETVAYLKKLWKAGYLPVRIAEATGVPEDTMRSIFRSGRTKIRQSTATAILGYVPDPAHIARAGHVNALPTVRRLRALTALGHNCMSIAHLAPVPAGKDPVKYRRARAHLLKRLRHGDYKTTNPTAEADTAAAYEALWNREPDRSTRAQNAAATNAVRIARANGWLPPMYWDDDRLADPSYTPRIPFDSRYGDTPNG